MKKQLLKLSGLAAAFVLSAGVVSAYAAEPQPAAEGPAVTLEDLKGTYVELFPEFEKDEYKETWLTRIQDVTGVDEEAAEMMRTTLISMMEADVYGEEASALAAEDPTYSMFDCYFINGPVEITVEGDEIFGTDQDGNEVFRHTYVYEETVKADFGAQNEMYEAVLSEEDWPTMDIYTAQDADDDFKYFAFAGDTPASTYHIEFRYGGNKEDLPKYFDGSYAYWLAAGIPADYSEELITDCINLFVDENAPQLAAMFTADAEAAAAE